MQSAHPPRTSLSSSSGAAMTLARTRSGPGPSFSFLVTLYFFMSFRRRRLPHLSGLSCWPGSCHINHPKTPARPHPFVTPELTSCPCCCALQLLISKEPLIKSFCTSTMRNAFTGRTICQRRGEKKAREMVSITKMLQRET